MDKETLGHLWALRMVNQALIDGMKLAVHALENLKDLSPERRLKTVQTLKELILESELAYEDVPTKH